MALECPTQHLLHHPVRKHYVNYLGMENGNIRRDLMLALDSAAPMSLQTFIEKQEKEYLTLN